MFKGICVDDNEFRICQYADDTVFFIDLCKKSFTVLTKIIDLFTVNAGLKINYDKCFVKRIGPCKWYNIVYCDELPIIWSHDLITYLGIIIPNDIDNITSINFASKIKEIKDCLKPWKCRKLSIMGKTTILKCLVMPKLTYGFSILPNPELSFFQDLQNILFNFLWDDKQDRIKRNVLYSSYREGGLQIPHVKSICFSLKCTWVKRFLKDYEKWVFLNKILANKGGIYFLDCNLHFQNEVICGIQDDFYRNVFEAWFHYKFSEPANVNEIRSENIWFNSFIVIDHRVHFIKSWFNKGVKRISDLCTNDGGIMSYPVFCESYGIKTNILTYLGIVHAIPKKWRDMLTHDKISTLNVSKKDVFMKSKQPAKIYYNHSLITTAISLINNKLIERWNSDLNLTTPIKFFQKAFITSYKCTLDPALRNFNFKFLHRISPHKSFLHKAKLVQSPICNFCNECEQTFIHLFWTCKTTKTFWKEILSWLKDEKHIDTDGLVSSDLLIIYDNVDNFLLLNTVFVLCKFFIFSCSSSNNALNLRAYISRLRTLYELESNVSFLKNKSAANFQKWSPIF